jgi:hypothetical protein
MVLYGTLVTLRLRKHTTDTSGLLDNFAEIVFNLDGQAMRIVEQMLGNE